MALAIRPVLFRKVLQFRDFADPCSLVVRVSTASRVDGRWASTLSDDENRVSEGKGPLSGIRVLDLTRILAGPFCTMILGDLGAEVIKVEKPGLGDETRQWGPPFKGRESCYFLSINRNKKSIMVDFKKPEGKKIIRDLAAKSDILVENYIPGALEDAGLGYKALSKINPKIIQCSITGFGQTGPYNQRAGYDVIAASVGGLMHITGPEHGEPCKIGVAMTDLATALYAHGAIMAALLQRQATGLGQKISCDLLSTQVSLLVNLASNYLNAGKEAKRWGTAHESIVPYQAFKTADDGWVTVAAGTDNNFKTLCKILDMEHLIENPDYRTNQDRVAHRVPLLAEISNRIRQKPTNYWLSAFEGSGIPYGPINSMKEVFADPQVLHNNMVVEMKHPVNGPVKVTGPAVSFSRGSNTPRLPPPILGEHTREVLVEVLGISDERIEQLKEANVIA